MVLFREGLDLHGRCLFGGFERWTFWRNNERALLARLLEKEEEEE